MTPRNIFPGFFLSDQDDQPHIMFLIISSYGYLRAVDFLDENGFPRINYKLSTPVIFQDPFHILASTIKGFKFKNSFISYSETSFIRSF